MTARETDWWNTSGKIDSPLARVKGVTRQHKRLEDRVEGVDGVWDEERCTRIFYVFLYIQKSDVKMCLMNIFNDVSGFFLPA